MIDFILVLHVDWPLVGRLSAIRNGYL